MNPTNIVIPAYPEDEILPVGQYEAGRFTQADESRFTATKWHRNSAMPIVATKNLGNDDVEVTLRSMGNEERFTAAFYSEPLTQYAVGWTDGENLQAVLDFIAPRVPVGRRFEYKEAYNAEAFLSETDDTRAIGADFKRIEYKQKSTTSKTNNHGLTYRLDLDEEGAGPMTEELIIARILQRLRRNQVRAALTALYASCTSASGGAKTWSSGAVSPAEDIRTAALACLTDSGLWPNRLLWDITAWSNFKKGQAIQLTAGSIAQYALRTPQDVADDIPIDRAMLTKAVYQNAQTTKALLTANKVVLFPSQDAPSRDDPTSVKNFVTPVGDGDFRVYRQPFGAKFIDLTVEYYNNLVSTATVGAAALTIS